MFEALQEIVKDTYLIEEILYRLEDVFERAEEDEQYYKALYQLAIYYHKISHLEAAIQLLLRLYQISPHRKVIYALAKLYYEFAEYEVAFEWLTRLESNELQYKPALLKAKILFEMGELEQAKEILLLLIKQFPTEQTSYHLIAEVYEQQCQFDQAERYYRIMYDYFEAIAPIRTKILEMMLYKEYVDIEAVKNLVQSTEELSTQEAYLLALLYQRGKELPQAIRYAELATESDIDYIEGHLLLMELYAQIERSDKLSEEIAWLSRTIPPFDERILEIVPFAQNVHYFEEMLLNKLEDYYWVCTDIEEAYLLIRFIVLGTLYSKDAQSAYSLLTQLGKEYFTDEELSYLYGVVHMTISVEKALEYFRIAHVQAIPDEELVHEIVDYMLNKDLTEYTTSLQAKGDGELYD